MIVLDTHTLIWWADGDTKLSRNAAAAIRKGAREGGVGISTISAWEVGMLVSKGRLALNMGLDEWFATIESIPGVRMLPLNTSTALDSTRLPGSFHGDPADRMIVATARSENAPLVTADRKIRAYQHVQTIW